MPIVIGVRFKDSGKTYYFDPRDLILNAGESVIVETTRGLDLAQVVHGQREVSDEEVVGELKTVVRRAEASDFERMEQFHARHDEVLARCAEKVTEHSLPMHLVKAEYSFDGSRLTFYFTAEKRVDFRLLVRDLARTFRVRIELRQIGPRDEAKLLGGIGPCGRLLCCASFLPDYARVSIKMAKDQDLPLNPAKISGVCGRLLCCLSYEHEQYIEMRAVLPRKGSWVQTPDGPGEVIGQNVLRQQVVVQLASSGMHETYNTDQIQEAADQVAAIARARNAEGITPPTRRERKPVDRGERQLLRDTIDNYDALDSLAALEDDDGYTLRQMNDGDEQRAARARGRPQGGERRAGSERPRPAQDATTPPARADEDARQRTPGPSAPPQRTRSKRADHQQGKPGSPPPREAQRGDAPASEATRKPPEAQARPAPPHNPRGKDDRDAEAHQGTAPDSNPPSHTRRRPRRNERGRSE